MCSVNVKLMPCTAAAAALGYLAIDAYWSELLCLWIQTKKFLFTSIYFS